MYPRSRLDALGAAVFGVAMTLLILDVRLPDDFHPGSAEQLLHGLRDLLPKFIPYALSFGVLGLRWLSSVQVRTRAETVGRDYTGWWLLYLLLITCVPFTTIVLGRFADLAPSIWLYAGNTALLGAVSLRLMARTPELEHDDLLLDRQVSLGLLIASSVLAIAVSLFDARYALLALALNLCAPIVVRWRSAKTA